MLHGLLGPSANRPTLVRRARGPRSTGRLEEPSEPAMKLTIERGALLKSLGHVQNVVERRNTIPILSNVLLEAGSNSLGLTATDMDLTIIERVPVSVGSNGAATVPAHTLYDIVRKLPEGAQVEIDGGGEGGQATVRAGRSKFSLPTLPRPGGRPPAAPLHGPGRGAARPDRPQPLRHLHRGDALLPERHLSPRPQ